MTPMAALAVSKLPVGAEWEYEVKLDGYRALVIKNGDGVQTRSPNNKDLTPTYPSIAAAGARLEVDRAGG
jgi:bifunctional non-homologous end joining protein LigD